MKAYNYLEEVTNDVINYIKENEILVTSENREQLSQDLYNDLWVNDSVTGNGSGSYTNYWQAEENLCHNLDLLGEAMEEFCTDFRELKYAEVCDVTIRCYLLPQAIERALNEVEVEFDEITNL